MVYPDSCFDPRTDVFLHGFPNLRNLKLENMRDNDIEYARALIAHAVRPTLVLEIQPFTYGDPNIDVWRLFDTVIFALRFCHKSQVRFENVRYRTNEFPLVSLLLAP